MSKAIFKYNGGRGALLCNDCGIILKIGIEYNELERAGSMGEKLVDAQFCLSCNIKKIYNDNKSSIIDNYLSGDILLEYLNSEQMEKAIELKYIETDYTINDLSEPYFKILI